MLHVNHEFCLHMATRFRPGGRFLDYGCGGGEVVAAGNERGLDIYGSEVFFGGGPLLRSEAESTGLLGTRILPMEEGRLPFPDGHFDFVFHNQVFEHVPDIDLALKEISRVLKPNGLMLSVFPTREMLWDPHCRIPFIHWFDRESRIGYAWMLTLRRLGFGTTNSISSPEEWAKHFISYIHDWCHYRPFDELSLAYCDHGFTFEPHDIDYVDFRLASRGRGRWSSAFARAEPITHRLLRRLWGVVILSARLSDAASASG
jgi:SAM-dependent methyltransferase